MGSPSIRTATARSKLTPRREPYWERLRKGTYVGYRKLGQGAGTWVGRWRSEDGKQHYNALGGLPDQKPEAAFDGASKLVREWADGCDAGVRPKAFTVAEACADYIEYVRAKKGDAKAQVAQAYIRRLVEGDEVALIPLNRLKAEHLKAWRKRISKPAPKVGRGERTREKPRAPGTVNRDMVPLRAALNLAHEHGLIASDMPWRGTLKPIEGADRRRDIYLQPNERKALCAGASASFVPFLSMLCLLPLRPGAVAGLKVGDFDKSTRVLAISDDKGAAHARKIKLPDRTARFVHEHCKGKLPGAPIFADASGAAWHRHSWKKEMRAAVSAASVRPDVVLYTLRHSTITDLVTAGTLDLLTIAKIAGTSVEMIQKHYGHLRADHAAQGLAALSL